MNEVDLDRRGRLTVLLICCSSLFVVGLDATAVNLALPSIQRDFHTTLSQLQWVVDAYTLTLAGLLILGGSLADRLGRRRIFRVGLSVFGLGSLACSLAPTPALLIAARALQAVGGAMLNPVAMSIITNTFTDSQERARAIGVWGGVYGLSMVAGPLLGGSLVDLLGWRSIFWLNVPVVLSAIVLTTRYVPESRAPHPRRFDPVGQVLVVAALSSLTFAIIEGEALGWTSPVIVGCLAVTVFSAGGIAWYEPRREQPLLELRFFRSVPFTGAVLAAIVGFAVQGGFLLILTLYLQGVRGLVPFKAGLFTLPIACMTVVFAPISGRIVGARGPRIPMAVSGVLITTAMILLTRLRTDSGFIWLAVVLGVFGLGFGVLNAPITNAALSGMPRAQAGVAGAIASTSRQVGVSLGVAGFGALAFHGVHASLAQDLAHASHPVWVAMIGCGVVIVAIAFLTTGEWARRSTRRLDEELGQ